MRLVVLLFAFFASCSLTACGEQVIRTDGALEYSQLASEILRCIPKEGDGRKTCQNLEFNASEPVMKVLNGMDLSSLCYVGAEKERDELIRLDFRCEGRMTAHVKIGQPSTVYLSIPLY